MAKANVSNSTTSAQPQTAPDPHLAWWQENERLWADAHALDDDQEGERDALVRQAIAACERIADTPASSFAGALAQLRVAHLYLKDGDSSTEVRALCSAITVLERMAGEA